MSRRATGTAAINTYISDGILPTFVEALLDMQGKWSDDGRLNNVDLDEAGRAVIDWFRSDVPALLDRAHVHTNGFVKFVRVMPDMPSTQIRLHHWPIGGDHGWSSIHNHRGDFTSVVLSGGVNERLYRAEAICPSGSEGHDYDFYDHRPYNWMKGGQERIVRIIPNWHVRLAVEAEGNHEPGEVRHLRPRQFHQVLASPLTTTLVVRGPVVRSRSQIAVPAGESPRLASNLQELSHEQAAEVLNSLIDKLWGPTQQGGRNPMRAGGG